MAREGSRRGVDVAIVIGVLVMVGCGFWLGYLVGRQSLADDLGSAFESLVSAEQASGQSPKEGAQGQQVFSSDVAVATYRDTMEPTQGNIMFNFLLENKSDRTVLVGGENIIINGEYSVQTLGGAVTPIAPGTTGLVSLAFGYSVQTPLQSADEIHSMSCVLVLRDNDSLSTVIDSVPVAVEV